MTIQTAFNFALQHHQSGRLAEAEAIYRQILAQQPNHADSLQMLGMIVNQHGRPAEAVQLISTAISINPKSAEYYANLAVVLGQIGRVPEAIAAFGKAIELKPGVAEFHGALGDLLSVAGRGEEAIEQFRRAAALRPDFAEAYYNMGNVFNRLRRGNEALEAYARALKLRPNWPELVNNYGNMLCNLGRYDTAIEQFRRAATLRPQMAETYCNLGHALRGKMELDAAEDAYRQALALKPDLLEAQTGLGCIAAARGNLHEAAALHQRVLDAHPDYAQAHWELAPVLLALGDWKRGWEEFEWRWKVRELLLPTPPQTPKWDGGDAAGKTILLHAEQGWGDNIQFARYIPLVAKRGAKVILFCQEELLPLMRGIEGVESFLTFGQPIPPHDAHCPVLSLPRVLGLEGEIRAAVPYLFADAERVEHWRARLPAGGRKKVGIAWRGRDLPDRFRSIPLERLAPLAMVKDVDLISLQTGAGANESPPLGLNLIKVGEQIRTFSDTAALITLMDLVITIDTSTAHLAGALGRPTWLLLRHAPDWRWRMEGTSCAWYPTMRVFRQATFGDWETPVRQVAEALLA